MDAHERFIQWVTETPVAHPQSAWSAWVAQQRQIEFLHSEIIRLQDALSHREQQIFESKNRSLRLVHSAPVKELLRHPA